MYVRLVNEILVHTAIWKCRLPEKFFDRKMAHVDESRITIPLEKGTTEF
jgi:hypothetical protein